MVQIFKNTSYNFVDRRKIAFIISGILIIITIISLIAFGGLRYGVDFTGGTLLEIRFQSPITTENLRSAFRNLSVGNASIQQFGGGNDFIVRFEAEMGSAVEDVSTKIMQLLQSQIPDNPAEIVRIEMVGPRIGKELQRNALIAVVIGLIGILFYMSIRFDFRFGTAAVISLCHDVFTSIGFIAVTRTEISIPIIAALLTVIGYSVNNSIVISDRIRENRKKMLKESFFNIINISINQTLARTVLTALTTFIVSLCLWILGAASIRDFAKVISFGIVVGTYSSIFICGSLVAEWEKRFPTHRRR